MVDDVTASNNQIVPMCVRYFVSEKRIQDEVFLEFFDAKRMALLGNTYLDKLLR